MRRLLLTSGGPCMVREISTLLGGSLSGKRFGYVVTASNEDRQDAYKNHERTVELQELGVALIPVDFADVSMGDIRETLKDVDALYVQGGDTFYLLQQIRKSGFTEVVHELFDRGIPYIGVSAGSHVACPTIEVATWNPNRDRRGMTDLTAMNLVPFLVNVHFKEKWRESICEKVRSADYPVYVLADGQAVLVEDERIQFVGDGDLVTL